jgi:hypothetical protein
MIAPVKPDYPKQTSRWRGRPDAGILPATPSRPRPDAQIHIDVRAEERYCSHLSREIPQPLFLEEILCSATIMQRSRSRPTPKPGPDARVGEAPCLIVCASSTIGQRKTSAEPASRRGLVEG